MFGLVLLSRDGSALPVIATLGAGVVVLVRRCLALRMVGRRPPCPGLVWRQLSAGIAVAVAGLFAVTGVFFLTAIFLQRDLGFTALEAAIALLPQTGLAAVLALLWSARVIHRFGLRQVLMVAFVIEAVGAFWLLNLDVHSTYLDIPRPARMRTGSDGRRCPDGKRCDCLAEWPSLPERCVSWRAICCAESWKPTGHCGHRVLWWRRLFRADFTKRFPPRSRGSGTDRCRLTFGGGARIQWAMTSRLRCEQSLRPRSGMLLRIRSGYAGLVAGFVAVGGFRGASIGDSCAEEDEHSGVGRFSEDD